ncbi:hypothetical protein ACOMHN_021687 [Nucella lapillus]
MSAFEDEFRRRRQDLDSLQTTALALTEHGATPLVEPALKRLNRRWQDLRSQLSRYNSPAAASSSSSSHPRGLLACGGGPGRASSGGGPEEEDGVCGGAGQWMEEVLRLLGQVGVLQQRLKSGEPRGEGAGVQLDVQNTQLKALEGEMVSLQPAVSEVERQRDSALRYATGQEASALRELTAQLADQWAALHSAFTDRQQ